MSKYLEFKNISTILTTIFLTVFGAILGYLASKGINLPITAETLTTITVSIIFLVFAYYNAKNHNDLFDQDADTIYIPIDNLTDDQINTINNLIEKTVSENIGDDDVQ